MEIESHVEPLSPIARRARLILRLVGPRRAVRGSDGISWGLTVGYLVPGTQHAAPIDERVADPGRQMGRNGEGQVEIEFRNDGKRAPVQYSPMLPELARMPPVAEVPGPLAGKTVVPPLIIDFSWDVPKATFVVMSTDQRPHDHSIRVPNWPP